MKLVSFIVLALFSLGLAGDATGKRGRMRDFGITTGILPTGPHNAITDVPGVAVGHCTLIEGESVRTGVTVVVPAPGNLFQRKVAAAVYVGNGFGKLAGSTQVEELGSLETPIVLTNTLSVPTAMEALIDYTLSLPGNEAVRSVNALVGETNDGFLSDIRGRHVQKNQVLEAIRAASGGPVAEGSVGAGTGTVCFDWKGGIGTSSRQLPPDPDGAGYRVGVLVQTNFGGTLQIAGVPVGLELWKNFLKREAHPGGDDSCMMVVATDAPLTSRNLKRLAKRAMLGLARTGGIAANGSGDYAIAFSTSDKVRTKHESAGRLESYEEVRNDDMTPLFIAVIEATEEAIHNSLFAAETVRGMDGHEAQALPIEEVLKIMGRFGRLKKDVEAH